MARTVSNFGLDMAPKRVDVSARGGATLVIRLCDAGLEVGGRMGGSLSVRREFVSGVNSGYRVDDISLSWNRFELLADLVVGLLA